MATSTKLKSLNPAIYQNAINPFEQNNILPLVRFAVSHKTMNKRVILEGKS